MRQLIISLNLIGSFAVFAVVTDLFEQMLMFILFGFVPGLAEPLTANQMLGIYGLATAGVTAYALRRQLSRISHLLPQTGSVKRSRTA